PRRAPHSPLFPYTTLFRSERTPSFSVNPQDKLYYCFGCGAGGDVITFVRETENLDFAGAVEWLADRFRVQLEYEDSSPRADAARSEEHTSELQSRFDLVCR